MFRLPRLSLNPAKQLMFYFLFLDMKKSKGLNIGLDIAAGDLANMKYFETNEYIAIEKHLPPPSDFTENEKVIMWTTQRNYHGIKHFEKKAFHQIDLRESEFKNDFSVLTETIGINVAFSLEDNTSLNFLNKLINNINDGGYLIINFGNHNNFLNKFKKEIHSLFSEHEIIRYIEYGRWSDREYSLISSNIRSMFMFCFWFLRKPTSEKEMKIYYFLRISHAN
jgi:hypothetical protein